MSDDATIQSEQELHVNLSVTSEEEKKYKEIERKVKAQIDAIIVKLYGSENQVVFTQGSLIDIVISKGVGDLSSLNIVKPGIENPTFKDFDPIQLLFKAKDGTIVGVMKDTTVRTKSLFFSRYENFDAAITPGSKITKGANIGGEHDVRFGADRGDFIVALGDDRTKGIIVKNYSPIATPGFWGGKGGFKDMWQEVTHNETDQRVNTLSSSVSFNNPQLAYDVASEFLTDLEAGEELGYVILDGEGKGEVWLLNPGATDMNNVHAGPGVKEGTIAPSRYIETQKSD